MDYHLGSSFASSIHGVPRQTQDIDLVLDLHVNAIDSLAAKLGTDFYLDVDSVHEAVRRKGSTNLVHLASGIKIDIFVRGDSPFDLEEFSRARLEAIDIARERRIHVKTAEDILLRKLQWYRIGGQTSDRQWHDVLGIIRTQGAGLDIDYLRHWARELEVEDLLDRGLNA